jgi:purine-binding chemotaxis protein CheW
MESVQSSQKGTAVDDGLFAKEKEEETIQLLLFELDKELYAVSVDDIDQVMRIPPVTSVPNAPESILGIFHLRGKVIVAIDILKRMRVTRTSPFSPLFLFVSHKDKNYFAVVVDRVLNVIRIPKGDITALAPVIASKINGEYVRGVFMHADKNRQKKKTEQDFLIQSKEQQAETGVNEEIRRPVLWLNVGLLLDQDDILELSKGENAASQPAGGM